MNLCEAWSVTGPKPAVEIAKLDDTLHRGGFQSTSQR